MIKILFLLLFCMGLLLHFLSNFIRKFISVDASLSSVFVKGFHRPSPSSAIHWFFSAVLYCQLASFSQIGLTVVPTSWIVGSSSDVPSIPGIQMTGPIPQPAGHLSCRNMIIILVYVCCINDTLDVLTYQVKLQAFLKSLCYKQISTIATFICFDAYGKRLVASTLSAWSKLSVNELISAISADKGRHQDHPHHSFKARKLKVVLTASFSTFRKWKGFSTIVWEKLKWKRTCVLYEIMGARLKCHIIEKST